MPQTKTCTHEGCRCPIPDVRKDNFCSDYCAKHGGVESHQPHRCGCGHPGCKA